MMERVLYPACGNLATAQLRSALATLAACAQQLDRPIVLLCQ
jgi:hypothetical protein